MPGDSKGKTAVPLRHPNAACAMISPEKRVEGEMGMVKLVFSDLDDTFLNAEKAVTPLNARALDLLAECGVQFVPCSGRNVNMLPAELLDHPAVKYAVCGNGALIVDAKTKEVLCEKDIPKETVLRLYEALKHLAITFDVFADGCVYAEAERFPYVDEVELTPGSLATIKNGRTVYDGTTDELLKHCGDVCRINIFYHNEAERDACWEVIDADPGLTRSSSLACNIEVTRVDAHKGASIEWLCDRLNVAVADTVAFGDNNNDVSMIATAGDGVAMENALPEVKAVADHICGSAEESGVGEYLLALLR